MPGNEKRWHANAERDLCLAIILGNQETERPRHNWPKVHAILNDLGYTFTQDAISQHFTKTVMRDFKIRHGKGVSQGPSSSTSTPQKPTPKKRGTPARQAKSKAIADEEDDDDAVVETPSKKIKREIDVKSIRCIKTEHGRSPSRERSVTAQAGEAEFQAWDIAGGMTFP
ncbi:hypothetical protein B0J13DRAFT_672094 [Dactylonectria estremocensis]|uniref:Uncharacterized protein n=1 Tax=Dactylonectria estremocensis TaxID=1079267 RepID=A0A9P9JCJ1_9HYPO|nr:hypothetical protein B0J13DRAFT_672094 [Dactylonectria estremocensis]